MIEELKSILGAAEKLFEQYQFTKDFIITCMGVVFGGVITVIINKGAIRKQAYFDLQYKILDELIQQVYDLEKQIEHLEIALSFGDRKTQPFENQILSVEKQALALNEVFREKRVLVHKYLTGVMLEESAQIPGKLYGVIYDTEKGGLFDLKRKEIVSIKDIETLRELTANLRKLKNQIVTSLEKLIFPSMFSKVKRRIKKIKVVVGNLYGIWKISKIENRNKT